jgi:hypothetical protein
MTFNYDELMKHECRNHFRTIDLWHQASMLFDKRVGLYIQDKNNYESFLTNMELIQETNDLVLNYFWLVSKIMRKYLNTPLGERVTSSNIPYEIEILQCFFIESCASRYYAVRKLQKSSGRFNAGVDNVAFCKTEDKFLQYCKEQLVGTRYKMSSKSTQVRKDLPQKAVLTEKVKKKIRNNVIKMNTKLGMQLYESCDLKTFYKSYKGDIIKRIWVSKFNSVEKRSLCISTLRDRILQTIIDVAAHPVVEYQADLYSFSYRTKRCAFNAIDLLIDHLQQQNNSKAKSKLLPIEVSKERYDLFRGRRFRKKRTLKNKNVNLRQREYFYSYYICGTKALVTDQEVKQKPFLFFSNYHIINANIQKCFVKIHYQTALKKYPLCNKYRSLLES